MVTVARQVMLDGAVVRAWAAGAVTACRAARERIDAVNVFPVPDADTGSNVALTVAGGAHALARDGRQGDGAALAATFALGAARAARGSSGIILSQWLVGFAQGLAGAGQGLEAGTAELVHALEHAASTARGAVPDPQEGTVLTVAREVAVLARRHAGVVPAVSPVDVLAAATDAARADLERLSEGHDVLRAARVVDAGACALLVVLDALVHALRTGARALDEAEVDLRWLPQAGPDVVARCAPATGGAFEVMMLVRATWAGVTTLAAALQGVGDAVAVVDAGGLRHAHVHCDDPAAAIGLVPAAARAQVVVRRVDDAPAARGLVVLTASPGLAAWYATCGAVTLVGTDPGAQQVGRAAADTRAGRAVVVDAGVGLRTDDAHGDLHRDLHDDLHGDLHGDLHDDVGDGVGGGVRDDAYDVLVTDGDGAAVVVCLAIVADPPAALDVGRQALARVRCDAPAGADAVQGTVAALLRDVPHAQGATLVHGPDVDPGVARTAAAAVAAAHPQLEVVVAGPAVGPAWWVGVD